MRTIGFAFLALGLIGTASAAGTPCRALPFAAPTGFTDATWVSGITNPTSHCWTPDGRMLVCQKNGALRVIKNGSLLGTAFATLTVDTSGERGLLGVTVDPNFNSNHFVYVYYSNASPMENRLGRFTANGDVASGGVTVLKTIPIGDVYHNGGAIHFGPDGKIYVAVGDSHSSGASSQDPNVMGGKILRLNADGSIPGDNPTTFQGGLATSGGTPREGWCCGLRNPYTFAFQPGTGKMYINDVGQNTWEEINLGAKGANYGWHNGSSDGAQGAPYTDPLYQYNHSGSPGGCAITGGTFYNPSTVMFPTGGGASPDYVGKYFFSDYCGNWIRWIDPNNTGAGTTAFTNTVLSGPVDLSVGPDGALYYSAQNSNAIGRISYTPPVSQSIVVSTNSLTFNEGASGTFTVKLAVMPASNVTVTLTRTGDTNISAAPTPITFTTSNWNTAVTVTVSSVAVNNGANQTANIAVSAPALTTQNVAITALDAGLPAGPTATISKPANGDVVSGTNADFFGQGSAGGSPLKKAEFYIDGVLASTDPYVAAVGHFHFNSSHDSWDTTPLSDGMHVIQMKVIDNAGMSATDTRFVVVANGPAFAQDAGGDHLVVIEAENYSQNVLASGHGWTSDTSNFPGFSGATAMQATPNDNAANINTGYATTSPRLDYLVDFKSTGTHYIWVRGWGPDGSSDSLHMGLDGAEIATSDRITGWTAAWSWSNQTMDGVVASFDVPSTGVHCVSVWMREDGCVIDKFVLTTNAAMAAPSGSGPAMSTGGPGAGAGSGSSGSGDGGGGGGGGCGLIGLEAALLALLRLRARRGAK